MCNNINELLDNLKKCMGCESFAELSEKLDIPMCYFTDAHRTGKIRPGILQRIVARQGITHRELFEQLHLKADSEYISVQ